MSCPATAPAVSYTHLVDALRFFLLRTFPFGSDGNFSNELLISTINTDLANKLGNLVSRTTGMVEKYFGGKLPAAREDAPEDCDLKKTVCALRGRYEAEMDKLQLQNGLDEIFKVIDRANKYIDETAPWTLGKDESLSLIHIFVEAQRRAVVEQGVHPHIDHMAGIEVHGDAPLEAGTADA